MSATVRNSRLDYRRNSVADSFLVPNLLLYNIDPFRQTYSWIAHRLHSGTSS